MLTKEEAKSSTWSVDCSDRIFCVEFSPFDWSGSLIAFGTRTRITIASCKFADEDADVEGMEFEILREFNHGIRMQSIAWSPETSLTTVPKVLKFASGGADCKIRIYTSDMKKDIIQMIEGHTSYVNAIVFEPHSGDQIASVSDDYTCRVWNLEGENKAIFYLRSPGVAVCWHKQETAKLLVAECSGIVRFYNLITQQPIMSLDCGSTPLMDADWSSTNSLQVGCVAGTNWYIWNTSHSSQPLQSQQAHVDGATAFRWSRSNENLLATVGLPGNQIKVFHSKLNQVCLESSLLVAGGLTWHHKLPIFAVGGDRKIHFWKTDAF